MITVVLTLAAASCLADGLVYQRTSPSYLALALSVVAVALFVGEAVLRRRQVATAGGGTVTTATDTAGTAVDRIGATDESNASDADNTPAREEDDRGRTNTDVVWALPGRKRYHRADCRAITGRESVELSVSVARKQNYTACGLCTPKTTEAEQH